MYSIFGDELFKYWQSMLLLVLLKPGMSLITGLLLHHRGSLDIYELNHILTASPSQTIPVTETQGPAENTFTVIISAADSTDYNYLYSVSVTVPADVTGGCEFPASDVQTLEFEKRSQFPPK